MTDTGEWVGYRGRFILLDYHAPDAEGFVGEREGIAYGLTNDDALARMLREITGDAVTAWHLHHAGALPVEHRLMENVTAYGFGTLPFTRVERPRIVAEMQRAGLDPGDIPDVTVWDYRSERGIHLRRYPVAGSTIWQMGMSLQDYYAAATTARGPRAPAPEPDSGDAWAAAWRIAADAPPLSLPILTIPAILPAPSMVGTWTPWPMAGAA